MRLSQLGQQYHSHFSAYQWCNDAVMSFWVKSFSITACEVQIQTGFMICEKTF